MASLLVNIDVPDIDLALKFYTSALGLTLQRKLGPEVIELGGAPVPIYLIQVAADSRPFAQASVSRSYERHWTPVHLDFVVASLERAMADAVAAGGLLEGEPRHERWGKIANLADPWGNGFCLIEFVGRGYRELCE